MTRAIPKREAAPPQAAQYFGLVDGIRDLLHEARRSSARAVNALMTATYWEIGRRLLEFGQGGRKRAAYGADLFWRLSEDLTVRIDRGFSCQNL